MQPHWGECPLLHIKSNDWITNCGCRYKPTERFFKNDLIVFCENGLSNRILWLLLSLQGCNYFPIYIGMSVSIRTHSRTFSDWKEKKKEQNYKKFDMSIIFAWSFLYANSEIVKYDCYQCCTFPLKYLQFPLELSFLEALCERLNFSIKHLENELFNHQVIIFSRVFLNA